MKRSFAMATKTKRPAPRKRATPPASAAVPQTPAAPVVQIEIRDHPERVTFWNGAECVASVYQPRGTEARAVAVETVVGGIENANFRTVRFGDDGKPSL